jgi:small subunit ribosomal protein S1
VVSSLRDFGAFIDIGGIDGLLPGSEISHQRGTKPSDVLAVGQEIEVQVLRIEKTDDPKRPERISLSLKSLARDPWQDVADRLAPGSKVQAKVARVEPFGAFVELAPGIEGLAHISELSGGRQAKHAREVVKPGDVIEVTVLSVDREKRRISLGTGEREDVVDAEDFAAAKRAAPERLGTLGDLFKNLKR